MLLQPPWLNCGGAIAAQVQTRRDPVPRFVLTLTQSATPSPWTSKTLLTLQFEQEGCVCDRNMMQETWWEYTAREPTRVSSDLQRMDPNEASHDEKQKQTNTQLWTKGHNEDFKHNVLQFELFACRGRVHRCQVQKCGCWRREGGREHFLRSQQGRTKHWFTLLLGQPRPLWQQSNERLSWAPNIYILSRILAVSFF